MNNCLTSHCVSAVSPPGASLEADYPHVAGNPGEYQLPPGEGCYSCNVDQNGIPLQKQQPATNINGRSSKRFRRDVPLPVSNASSSTIVCRTEVILGKLKDWPATRSVIQRFGIAWQLMRQLPGYLSLSRTCLNGARAMRCNILHPLKHHSFDPVAKCS